MKKDLVIVANASKPLGKFHCDKCGNSVIATKEVIANCPYCGSEFESEASTVKAGLTASLTSDEAFSVVCGDCSAKLNVYNSDNDAVDFSATRYCPVCGGSDLDENDTPEETKPDKKSEQPVKDSEKNKEEEEDFTQAACKDGSCDEIKSQEESIQEVQDDVRETLDSGNTADIDEEDLQWKAVDDEENGKNGTLIAFSAKSGNPLFVFRRKNCSDDLKDVFATSIMVQAFNQIARNDGIGTAVKKFGGNTYNTKEVMNSNYIDSLVTAKVNSEFIPKFIECMALVVDGAVKGVYPEIRRDIVDAMSNDLVGAGLPKDRVDAAVVATFGNGGTTVYASILAKAVELMRKTPEAYNEAKSMIASAQAPAEIDLDKVEQKEIRAKLDSNSGIILGSSPTYVDNTCGFDNDVSRLRKRLGFNKFK